MSGEEKPNTRERLKVLAPGFGDRVSEAVEALGGTALAAKAAGLGENQIRRIVNEETVPSFPAISLLAKKSGFRSEWLAFAEEPAKREEGVSIKEALPLETQAEPFYWVPELDARAAAGRGVVNEEYPEVKSAFPIPRQIIDQMRLNPLRLRIVQSQGDSMEPDIRNGDHMVIFTGEETLIDGAVYVLNNGDNTLVKRVQLDPRGGLKLISRNPAFPELPIAPEEREQLSFAGRVVMTLKKFA